MFYRPRGGLKLQLHDGLGFPGRPSRYVTETRVRKRAGKDWRASLGRLGLGYELTRSRHHVNIFTCSSDR